MPVFKYVVETVFMKLIPARRCFVKNFYTEFEFHNIKLKV